MQSLDREQQIALIEYVARGPYAGDMRARALRDAQIRLAGMTVAELTQVETLMRLDRGPAGSSGHTFDYDPYARG